MKKIPVVLLMTFVLALSAQAVYADAVYESGNRFYEQHKRDLVELFKLFIADGEDGSVSLFEAPGKAKAIDTFENGERCSVSYTCLYNGDYWGLATISKTLKEGWVRMDELLVPYTGAVFREEYKNEFFPFEGTHEEIDIKDILVLWAWPGSGVIREEFDWYDTMSFPNVNIDYAYRDDQDLEWVYISWFDHDVQNVWICVSDPSNRDLPVLKPAPDPVPWVPEATHVDIGGARGVGGSGTPVYTIVIIIALLTVVVVCTVLLIKRLYKPQ